MSDRELPDQIWLKMLEMEARLFVIEKQTACNHDFMTVYHGPRYDSPTYLCRKCGAYHT